jgi:hypothetical protein
VLALEALIEVREDPSIPGVRSPVDGGYVEVAVRTRRGRSLACRVERAAGSPERALSPDQLDAKFRDCTRALGPARVDDALRALDRLQELHDVRALVAELSPSGVAP